MSNHNWNWVRKSNPSEISRRLCVQKSKLPIPTLIILFQFCTYCSLLVHFSFSFYFPSSFCPKHFSTFQNGRDLFPLSFFWPYGPPSFSTVLASGGSLREMRKGSFSTVKFHFWPYGPLSTVPLRNEKMLAPGRAALLTGILRTSWCSATLV